MHMGYPAYLQATEQRPAEEHWVSMPAELKSQLIEYMASYTVPEDQIDGPCIWLDLETRRCRHHEHRPRVCRDFQVDGKGCREWRKHSARYLSAATSDVLL
ncbi:Flagellin N-methylase [Novipirellula artificiosorum]|uniref:Flagellin N-methylase n=2 Tax=Novipirellula artificiosorum TaxID=2528016 RepID=A0A5C6DI47_9BACT|nr:Flagellin N-methylase [Novipirellula artificiosorum]